MTGSPSWLRSGRCRHPRPGGRNASCCALLNRWISSMNTIVRRPVARRRISAAAMTSLISLIPERTALNWTKCALVISATMRARVVLPVPGGPHRMIDCRMSRSIASRRGLPGARMCSWPTTSSSVRGRRRSARGVPSDLRVLLPPGAESSSKREPLITAAGARRR